MQTIETTNGIFQGQEIPREKLPKSARLIGLGYLKLTGRYDFDAFTEVKQYATNNKTYLVIIKS